jgi:hypothetical protein
MTGMLLLLLLAGEAGAEDEDSATSNDIVEDASVRRQGDFFDNDHGACPKHQRCSLSPRISIFTVTVTSKSAII